MYLQRHSSAWLKCLGNLRIDFDVKVSILSNLFISDFDTLVNPLSKLVSCHCIHHINEPLLWQFWDLLSNRESCHDLRHLGGSCQDIFRRESFILRNMEVLNLITLDVLNMIIVYGKKIYD